MWKLIVYEFRSRIVGLYFYLFGLILWDFIAIGKFSKLESIELEFQNLFIMLFVPLIVVFFILLISNIYNFYHYFQTNNLSFLFIFPIKEWKILFSKLLSVMIEFFAIYGLHLLITMVTYSTLLLKAILKNPNAFADTASPTVYFAEQLFYILNIFYIYIVSLLVLFGFILIIRWAVQNSKTYFWITFLFVGGYFYLFFYCIIKVVDMFNKADINYFETVIKNSRFVTKETVVFLALSFILSTLVYWFFAKKSEF